MKIIKWDEEKNKILKKERGVSFEEILDSTFLGAEKHRTRDNQMVLLYEYKKYVWVVPCVVEDKYIFLKTMFPSRKYTKMFKNKKVKNEKIRLTKEEKEIENALLSGEFKPIKGKELAKIEKRSQSKKKRHNDDH